MSLELSEQELIRREKLKNFEALGIVAYPAEAYPVNVKNIDIHEQFTDKPEPFSIGMFGRAYHESTYHGSRCLL